MIRILKYCWFVFVMKLTWLWPDFSPCTRLRGFLLKPCFRKCGRNLQVCSNAVIVYSSRVSIGNDVFVGCGCWIQAIGGVTLEDEVMLGPYTVLASTDHLKEDRSYRFGPARPRPIVFRKGSWTGAHVVITAGVTVGAGGACAAGAVVTRDVPDDATVGGVPARTIKGPGGQSVE